MKTASNAAHPATGHFPGFDEKGYKYKKSQFYTTQH